MPEHGIGTRHPAGHHLWLRFCHAAPRAAALLLLCPLLVQCGRSSTRSPETSVTGTASSYPAGHHGARTTSGETYNRHAFTAAHGTLPMGTLLRVRNPQNGREVTVRINDRTPVTGNVLLCVSTKAALNLRMPTGTAPVEFTIVTERDCIASAKAR